MLQKAPCLSPSVEPYGLRVLNCHFDEIDFLDMACVAAWCISCVLLGNGVSYIEISHSLVALPDRRVVREALASQLQGRFLRHLFINLSIQLPVRSKRVFVKSRSLIEGIDYMPNTVAVEVANNHRRTVVVQSANKRQYLCIDKSRCMQNAWV